MEVLTRSSRVFEVFGTGAITSLLIFLLFQSTVAETHLELSEEFKSFASMLELSTALSIGVAAVFIFTFYGIGLLVQTFGEAIFSASLGREFDRMKILAAIAAHANDKEWYLAVRVLEQDRILAGIVGGSFTVLSVAIPVSILSLSYERISFPDSAFLVLPFFVGILSLLKLKSNGVEYISVSKNFDRESK